MENVSDNKNIAILAIIIVCNLASCQVVPKEGKYYTLKQALKYPEKVIEFDLSNQNLNNIPQEVFELQSLKVLKLSNNNIMEVPKDIALLTDLESLLLKSNKRLKYISPEVANLKQLKILSLIFCDSLAKLPNSMFGMKRLETIGVFGTQIDSNWLNQLKDSIPELIIYDSVN